MFNILGRIRNVKQQVNEVKGLLYKCNRCGDEHRFPYTIPYGFDTHNTSAFRILNCSGQWVYIGEEPS